MINFWGINFSNHSREKIFEIVDDCLKRKNRKKVFVTTINPEILLISEKNKAYKKILNKSNLKIVDGFGIKLMSFLKRKKISERLAGVDLANYILKKSVKKKLKIGFVIRKDGISSLDDLKKFSKNFHSDIISISCPLDKEKWGGVFQKIKDREVIFVGLGAPYQEFFIYNNLNNWQNLKLAIGVGGTFDFWTKKQKRAPFFMRKIGMEWFWRFLLQPKRFLRIWKATVIFTFKSLIKY